MPVFNVNKPVNQTGHTVKVDVSAAAPLPLGMNRFQLVVIDDAGNPSEPTFLNVIVRDTDKPTAVLQMVDASGRAIDPSVPFGTSFNLTGVNSKDTAPGKIVEYQFTLLDRV
jgi:hypothetical protein